MSDDDILKNVDILPDNMSLAAMIDHLGSDASMLRGRPYSGQAHTSSGTRGGEIVRNMTFRDLQDCFVRAYILSHSVYVKGTIQEIEPNSTLSEECKKGQNAAISINDMYTLKGDIDPMAVWQNMACEIEKAMGIYPNIGK